MYQKLIFSVLLLLAINFPQSAYSDEQVITINNGNLLSEKGLNDELKIALKNKKFQKAYEILLKLIKKNPDNYGYKKELGKILLELGKFSEAKKQFDIIIKSSNNQVLIKESKQLAGLTESTIKVKSNLIALSDDQNEKIVKENSDSNYPETSIKDFARFEAALYNQKILWKVDKIDFSGVSLKENDRKRVIENIYKFYNLKELNLSGFYLDNVPPGIENLINLELLDLSQNSKIKNLPDDISNLKKLKILKLRFTDIRDLPKNFGSLKNLEELDFEYGYFTLESLFPQIRNLNKLKKINLHSHPGVHSIDNSEQIKELVNLKNLSDIKLNLPYMSKENFNNLLIIFGENRNIKKLGLYIVIYEPEVLNDFKDSFILLSNLPLEVLELSDWGANFTENIKFNISHELGLLKSLKELDLHDLNLKSIPPEIFTLTNLRKLGLYQNGITVIPEEISNLTDLEELDLGQNGLIKIPDTISNLKNLKRFRILTDDNTADPEIEDKLRKLLPDTEFN
jgi:Leucine-rich repeat (LRR) protein